jgi:Thioesterase-like superfamily
MLIVFRHVNNVKYIRYAESGRINWIEILAKLDTENKQRWRELWTPRGKGLILKSIKTDFKFVSIDKGLDDILHPEGSHPESL